MRKIKLDKDRIKDLYWNKKLSIRKIAKEIRVSFGTIRKNMILFGIKRRPSTKRDLTKPTKEELERLYFNKKKPIKEVARNFDASVGTIFKWIKNYKILPSRRFRYKKYDFSGDPKEKAYILGLVAGDIHARKNSRQILAELTTTHPAMRNLFYSVFSKYGTPKEYIKHNKITERNEWRVYVLLNNSFEFMLTKNLDIDKEYFYDFLAGFVDCEGCLHIYNNHGYIGLSLLIYNSNKELLEVIKNRLERDGFNPKFSRFFEKGKETTNNYLRGTDLWAIRLHTNKEVVSLMNKIPVKHKEKVDKLKIAMSIDNRMWKDISEQVDKLKINIKNRVKEFTNPYKNEGSNVL